MICIEGVDALTPQGILHNQRLILAEGKIQSIAAASGPVPVQTRHLAGCGLVASPGYIDIQLNGGFGMDFTCDPESIWQVAARLPQFGVTSFLPTMISAPLQAYENALEVHQGGPPPGLRGAAPLGWHFEGPFLNPCKKGAHLAEHLRRPRPEGLAKWQPGRGLRMVTLAPELTRARQVAEVLAGRGIVVSTGHSLASYEEAETAFTGAFRCGTHWLNAMPPLEKHDPGLAGFLMTGKNTCFSIIADGVHVHPALVALAWQINPRGLILISDAMAALGMPPGEYKLAGQTVQVSDTAARLPDSALAGSILSPDAAVRNLAAFSGCGLPQALACMTHNPAYLLGLDSKGQLASGKDADLVLLTPDGQVQMTIIDGEIVFER